MEGLSRPFPVSSFQHETLGGEGAGKGWICINLKPSFLQKRVLGRKELPLVLQLLLTHHLFWSQSCEEAAEFHPCPHRQLRDLSEGSSVADCCVPGDSRSGVELPAQALQAPLPASNCVAQKHDHVPCPSVEVFSSSKCLKFYSSTYLSNHHHCEDYRPSAAEGTF